MNVGEAGVVKNPPVSWEKKRTNKIKAVGSVKLQL